MKLPPFPAIPDVEFRSLARYPGYAASSDGRIWMRGRRGWQVLRPRCYASGHNSVAIRRGNSSVTMRSIDELIIEAFPNHD